MQEPTPLNTIIEAYSKMAKEAKQKRAPGDPWPVIIVDEANRLTAWKDKEALEQLLAFFVYLTKQEQLAHVVLATSDTFLAEWLQSGPVKQQFRLRLEIGNLGANDAHTYFIDHVLPTFVHPPCDEKTWARVYSVCGGNPGQLLHCAALAAACRDWEQSCQSLVREAAVDISRALSPSTWDGAAWTADDCRTVLHMIASSPHAAVPAAQLEAHLGFSLFGLRLFGWGGAQKLEAALCLDGSKKLQSMNKMNLLLRRSYDPLARDIDAAAFGPKKQDVYTLPSAAHVCAARVELDLE